MLILIRRGGYKAKSDFEGRPKDEFQNFFSSVCYISRFLEAMAQYMELIDVFLERKTFSLRSGENF